MIKKKQIHNKFHLAAKVFKKAIIIALILQTSNKFLFFIMTYKQIFRHYE